MEVTLSPELEALIAEQVESGHYPSPGKVVRDALRLLQDKLKLPGSKLESLRRDVQAGLQALDQGEYDEHEDPRQLAAEIKARGRQRLESLANGAALRGTAGSHTAGGDQLPGGSPEKNAPLDLIHLLVETRLMIRLNVHEAKTHLSRYLARLAGGEAILLCKRNVPVAEIRPVQQPRAERRPVGLAKGRFEVPASFFDPLPEELVDAFAGK